MGRSTSVVEVSFGGPPSDWGACERGMRDEKRTLIKSSGFLLKEDCVSACSVCSLVEVHMSRHPREGRRVEWEQLRSKLLVSKHALLY